MKETMSYYSLLINYHLCPFFVVEIILITTVGARDFIINDRTNRRKLIIKLISNEQMIID